MSTLCKTYITQYTANLLSMTQFSGSGIMRYRFKINVQNMHSYIGCYEVNLYHAC